MPVDILLNGISMEYDPYPVGYFCPAFVPDTYDTLQAAWPDESRFVKIPELGNKLSLSRTNNGKFWLKVIKSKPWNLFHRAVSSNSFIKRIIRILHEKEIDIFISDEKLSTRWEFSMLPGEGGSIIPHTDSPHKIITFIFSFSDDWPEGDGGTEIYKTKHPKMSFNFMNRQIPWKDIVFLRSMPFCGNQCTLFVKTFNSLHGVRPLDVPGKMRKTITVNIIRDRFKDAVKAKDVAKAKEEARAKEEAKAKK